MAWQFLAIRLTYGLILVLSAVLIVLTAHWIVKIDGFYDDVEKAKNYEFHISRKYPEDVYYTIVFAGISFIVASLLCHTKFHRKYSFSNGIMSLNAFLAAAWLADAIVIVVSHDNGSMTSRDHALSKVQQYDPTVSDDNAKLDVALRIGKAIMAFVWTQFAVYLFMISIKLWVKLLRPWANDKDSFSHYDGDAREVSMDVEKGEIGYTTNGHLEHAERTSSGDEILAEAQYDFRSQEDDGFSFKTGDRIRILKKTNDEKEWWKGEINGKIGEVRGIFVPQVLRVNDVGLIYKFLISSPENL